MQRRLALGLVLQLGGAQVGGAHEHECARTGGAGRAHDRLQRIPAEQRVGRDGVGAKSGDLSPGRRRAADERLRVGRGRVGDITALAVRDHEQPALPREGGHLLEGPPARPPEALETGEL